MRCDLPQGWDRVPLGELFRVHHGCAFKGDFFAEDPPGDILLTPGNFAIGGGFVWGKRKYYRGPVEPRYVLGAGELMVTMTDLSRASDTLGSPALVPEPPACSRLLHNQRLGRVEITDPNRVDHDFIYCALRTEQYRHQVVAAATGTTVKHTSPTKIGETVIPLPPIAEQRRIVLVLGALDDKIDSSRRLAALLEETAATLFRARFVDFVGVEEFEESEIGPIPGGWEVEPLEAFVEQRREAGSADSVYIGLDDMPRASAVLDRWKVDNAPMGQSSRFWRGDILFGKLRPYFKKVGVAPIDGRCSTEIVVLRPRAPELFGYSIGLLTSQRFFDHCEAVSTGTRMPRAEWKLASALRVATPPPQELATFNDMAIAAHAYIAGLVHEGRSLTELRDRLLPKLISGEIRVPDTGAPDEVLGLIAEDIAAAVP